MTARLRDYEEKRDFQRMQVQTRAVLHTRHHTYDAVCVDLSSTGMQIRCKCNPTIGETVEVNIDSTHSKLGGLNVMASVVRVIHDTSGEPGSYLIGLKTIRLL